MAGSVTIRHAALVDPDSESVVPDRRIRIEDGTIVEIVADPGSPVASAEIDATGRYAVPGLIDCHVHVTAFSADEHSLTMQDPSYVAVRAAVELRATLRRGFTTVRDMAGATAGLALGIAEGHIDGPRLFFGGKALSQTGGHGDLRLAGQQMQDTSYAMPGLGRTCDGVSEVRRAARDEIRRGATHLKLMLSGGCSSHTDRIDSVQFSDEEIHAAVQEAAAAGIYCGGHAYTTAAVVRALVLGVRSIEHGNLMDTSVVPLFLQHQAFYVPTLVTYQALADEGKQHGMTDEGLDKVATVRAGGLQALDVAHRGGVDVAFGSDLLGGMRRRQSEEFRIRAEVQPAAAILRSATTVAARLLDRAGTLGVIAEGALGDLILTVHDPLADIRYLADPAAEITAVIRNGHQIAG